MPKPDMVHLPSNPIDQALLPVAARLRSQTALVPVWRFFATRLMFVLAAGYFAALFIFWQSDPYAAKIFGLFTLGAVLANESVSWLIGYIHYRLRPFVALHTTPLMGMSAFTKSFPSDHATIGFTLATALAMVSPWWGLAAGLMAGLIALGRVVAGVHYPTDILGGTALGILGTLFIFASALVYVAAMGSAPVFP